MRDDESMPSLLDRVKFFIFLKLGSSLWQYVNE